MPPCHGTVTDAILTPARGSHVTAFGGVLTSGVEDTFRRDRVVAVEFPIGREDLSGGVVDDDERRETHGHIDRGRPDERERWRSRVERMCRVLGQLELWVVGPHPEVLLDRRVDETAAQRGEDRDRQEEGKGTADDERAHRWFLRPFVRPLVRRVAATADATRSSRPPNVEGAALGGPNGSERRSRAAAYPTSMTRQWLRGQIPTRWGGVSE